jgi:1,2-dihydroxy-3-keto-5-methylthiopentene dioxygenase
MKVTVEPSDFILVPANRYHRFYLTGEKNIHCVRLFKDPSGWTPLYRKDLEATGATT